MSVLVGADTRVIVQGITGRDGSFHTARMIEYGTNVVGGVTPGKGGQTAQGVPVFDSVPEAVDATEADVSIMFVPAKFAKGAMLDAASADLRMLVVVTEGIPTLDVLEAYEVLSARDIRLIGPNCPGIISPGACKVGIMPAAIHMPGKIGLISRSGTLTYEIVRQLTAAGMGQSTCIGIGGDPIIGSTFLDLLPLFESDPETESVIIVGEIGGRDEVAAGEYVRDYMNKRVVAYVAGLTAPRGRRMGHAGAIVGGEDETASAKIERLVDVGIPVARMVGDIVKLVDA